MFLTDLRIGRVAALLTVAVLAGCGGGDEDRDAGTAQSTQAEEELRAERERTADLRRKLAEERARRQQAERDVPRPPEASGGEGAGVLLSPADARSFARLARRLGGQSGLAVSGLGRAVEPDVVGTLRGGPAWSTIKVPLAIAARGRGRSSDARAAITASDNAAAERLWSALGGGSGAGAAVERVLADAGDTATRVQTQRVRAGFTPFGQTAWSLADQQRFMAGVSCLNRRSRTVLDLMEQTVPAQRWGIGETGLGAQMKGGWGPDESGRYLVRQMGAVLLDDGRPLALSLATKPADGTLETGSANLSEIAQWAVDHVDRSKLPRSPRC